jgi:hypothetical protein
MRQRPATKDFTDLEHAFARVLLVGMRPRSRQTPAVPAQFDVTLTIRLPVERVDEFYRALTIAAAGSVYAPRGNGRSDTYG